MSHTATTECAIEGANQKTLDKALLHVCAMFDAHIKQGGEVMQYGGQKARAKGTVIGGLKMAAYGTDVDVHINKDGKIIVTGDAVSAAKISKEIEKAYKAESYRQALQRKGLKTKLTINRTKASYSLEAAS